MLNSRPPVVYGVDSDFQDEWLAAYLKVTSRRHIRCRKMQRRPCAAVDVNPFTTAHRAAAHLCQIHDKTNGSHTQSIGGLYLKIKLFRPVKVKYKTLIIYATYSRFCKK